MKEAAGLVAHHLAQAQATDQEKHRNHGQTHRNLIGNHLRAGPDPTQKRVFRVGGVSGENDPVNTKRDDAEGVQHPDIQICDDHLLRSQIRAKWNNRDREQARHHDDGGS